MGVLPPKNFRRIVLNSGLTWKKNSTGTLKGKVVYLAVLVGSP